MANVLDIKRRIRSVINTRQITKAMKMVSAAKLRRAQDRALAARPYAQMLTNVLKSLVSRAEIYDPETGEPRHPLLAQRPEQNILLIVVTGDKGLAGAFNTNILKAAMQFLGEKSGKNIEIEPIGRKGRDFLRRRFPMAQPRTPESTDPARTAVVAEMIGVLNKLDHALATKIAEHVIERYSEGSIDAVYLIFNEFKSVIQQRLVVERVLPIVEVGVTEKQVARELTQREKEEAQKAAISAGVGMRSSEQRKIDKVASEFATAPVDYLYEQSPTELFNALLPKYVGIQIFHALLES